MHARAVWYTQVVVDIEVICVFFASREDWGEPGHRGVGHAQSFLQTLLKGSAYCHHLHKATEERTKTKK